MSTGYSSIPPHLSHGDATAMRTLRERELFGSPRHAVHDTGDDGQSDGQAAVLQQYAEGYVEDNADIDMERGLTAVSWRADVTVCFNAIEYLVASSVTCSAEFSADFIHVDDIFHSLAIEQRKQDLIKSRISLTLHHSNTRCIRLSVKI